MPDIRFFQIKEELTLKALCDITGAELNNQDASENTVSGVAPLDKAETTELSFLDNVKYKDQFTKTNAGACFVTKEMAELAPANTNLLITDAPYRAYALAAQAIYPQEMPDPDISDRAHLSKTVKIGKGCVIEAGVVIHDGAEIGENSWIEANAVIGKNVIIGDGCRIGAGAVISHSLISNNVRIYPGCCIGQDGFGFAMDPSGFIKVPQLGRVVIEQGVEIGANTTIDRGAGPDTVIGAGTWIDNLVQIGHNVQVGKCCVIVSQVGISGSTVLEDFAVLGGQVGVAGHLRIGKGARIAAQSGIMRDIPAGEEHMGSPSMPIKQYMRQVASLNRLIKKKKS